MRFSLDHLPEKKQRELERAVEIIRERFFELSTAGTSNTKLNGYISKIILFGSYARGDWVDEPHTNKGYRSDFDILVIVSNRKLAEPRYWDRISDHLMWDKYINTPVGLIVHGAREVNNYLSKGQYFFVDITKEGVILFEADSRPLAEPRALTPEETLRGAEEQFSRTFRMSQAFTKGTRFYLSENEVNNAAFELHQAVETAYSTYLLTLTNYSPPSHNIKFLRGLAEGKDARLIQVWPRDQQRYIAWYNILNEAYVKARYSKHFEIPVEALTWLLHQTESLQALITTLCFEHIERLRNA